MAIENEKMKNYAEKKTPSKKIKHDSSDESSGPVVKKRKKATKATKEETNNALTPDTVKGKSSVLSKAIIESDDESNNIDPVESSEPSASMSAEAETEGESLLPRDNNDTPKDSASDEEMPEVKKKSRAIVESDDD